MWMLQNITGKRKIKTPNCKDWTFPFMFNLLCFCSFVYLAFNLVSINSQGLQNVNRRQNIFNLIKKQKYDITFLQETHWTD